MKPPEIRYGDLVTFDRPGRGRWSLVIEDPHIKPANSGAYGEVLEVRRMPVTYQAEWAGRE